MNKRGFWLVFSLALILIVGSLWLFLGTKAKKPIQPDDPLIRESVQEGVKVRIQRIKLFYFTDNSSRMKPVIRDFPIPEIELEKYSRFLELLFQEVEGYIVPIPGNVSILQAFFLENKGTLVLDFQEDILNQFPGGTSAEREFIYFVVDNICYNFKEVKKVLFLFGGDLEKTLSGHLDMERAFFPDFSWLADD